MADFLAKQRLLVVAPHADDEAFGCAGTIAKVKALGGKVYVMVMTIGDLRQYHTRGKMVEGKVRQKEFVATMKSLGVDGYDIVFKDAYTHLRLDTLPRRDLIAIIDRKSVV